MPLTTPAKSRRLFAICALRSAVLELAPLAEAGSPSPRPSPPCSPLPSDGRGVRGEGEGRAGRGWGAAAPRTEFGLSGLVSAVVELALLAGAGSPSPRPSPPCSPLPSDGRGVRGEGEGRAGRGWAAATPLAGFGLSGLVPAVASLSRPIGGRG